MKDITKTPLQLAIDALQEISNPIWFMQERAKKDGSRLNHYAITLSNDPNYLKGLASDALALLKVPPLRRHQ